MEDVLTRDEIHVAIQMGHAARVAASHESLRAEVERLRGTLADKERSLALAEVRHGSDDARIHGLVTEIEELRGRAYDDKLRIDRAEATLAGRASPPSAPTPRYDRATVEVIKTSVRDLALAYEEGVRAVGWRMVGPGRWKR